MVRGKPLVSARLIDGQAIARAILRDLSRCSLAFRRKTGRAPCLTIVTGPDLAAQSYLKSKLRACAEAGVQASVESAPADARRALAAVRAMAENPAIDAIMIEVPLPVAEQPLIAAIPPEKDAEGVTLENYGRLFAARSRRDLEKIPVPCTAAAVAEILRRERVGVAGKKAAVLGRSNILGKPAAHLLSLMDATVTLCHSKTRRLDSLIKEADIVVAGMGRKEMVKGSWLKRGAVVIDAGINVSGRKVRGDVDGPSALKTAGRLTPVPGGVGPVTTAMLLRNTLILAEARRR